MLPTRHTVLFLQQCCNCLFFCSTARQTYAPLKIPTKSDSLLSGAIGTTGNIRDCGHKSVTTKY